MSTRGSSIAADTPSSTAAPPLRTRRMATGLLPLVLANLVAIAAFLTTALAIVPRAGAEGAAAKTVPVFVTPGAPP